MPCKNELECFHDMTLEEKDLTVRKAATLAFEKKAQLPLTWKAYKLLLTAPISVAKDERTFSHLKFVKNYRSTMGDQRLDNLLLLNREKDLTDSAELSQLLSVWSAKPRR